MAENSPSSLNRKFFENGGMLHKLSISQLNFLILNAVQSCFCWHLPQWLSHRLRPCQSGQQQGPDKHQAGHPVLLLSSTPSSFSRHCLPLPPSSPTPQGITNFHHCRIRQRAKGRVAYFGPEKEKGIKTTYWFHSMLTCSCQELFRPILGHAPARSGLKKV